MSHDVVSPEQDLNFEKLAQVLKTHQPPWFVKQAEPQELTTDAAGRSVESYADYRGCRYPIKTAAECWASAAFLESFTPESADYTNQVADRIKAAADAFGIVQHVDNLLSSAVDKSEQLTANKKAECVYPSSGSQSGYPTVNKPSETSRLTVKSAADVRVALEQLRVSSAPVTEVKVAAAELRDFVETNEIEVDGKACKVLKKLAGIGYPDQDTLVSELEKRSLLEADYTKGWSITDTDYGDADSLLKLAEYIQAKDDFYGLSGNYDKTLMRPQALVFGRDLGEEKQAAASRVYLQTGDVFEKAAFACLDCSDVSNMFGDTFASECDCSIAGGSPDLEKLAEFVETLPAEDASILKAALTDAGHAVVKSASVDIAGLSAEY